MSKEEHMWEIRGARAFGVIRTVMLGIIMILPLEVRADVMFQGNLLDRPCKVDPASQMQDVTFLDTATPLYWVWPGKSALKTFQVTLVNCYASTVGKVVKLTFSGAEERALPGYLATTGANAGRLAIGFLDTDGSTLLRLGTSHHNGAGDVVTGSSLTLKFKAFVQATPDAISKKSVVPGDYSATATFEVNYQ